MPCLNRRRLIPFSLWLCVLFAASPALAGRERDREHAQAAVEQGQALPLSDILAKIRNDLGGELVGVGFERKQDRWVYEFKVIHPTGQLVEVYVDAATALILKREPE